MSAYKFRVLIDTESNEEIFRDILISSNDNLENFYQTIISAFEFKADQMASFYKSNDDWDKGQEVALMDMGFNDDAEVVLIMNETPVKELITESNQKIILVHDFMRMWCFLIELIETTNKTVSSPEILLAVGISPKEDSKSLDSNDGLGYGETLDLGNDFDDIFSDEDDDDEFDLDGYQDDTGENDFY